ncbi:Rieske 2Fe-2S domain-containing protein [Mycobacterium sp.]|uniref:Rieske 2Fe-2S domain-containing protein n=1 Tax=Mycobacterium sp. TaxID=1785 RepID=UPI0025F80DC5|nr:Rieske 2Fe-2S domain-containing protein [Mycobacterium sp.]
MAWEVLCSAHEVVADEIKECTLTTGATVIVLRTASGALKVFQGRCPHQQRSLADADMYCGVLTCAAHMWEFDVQTGEGLNGTLSRLAEYPIRVEGDDVLVDPTAVQPVRW